MRKKNSNSAHEYNEEPATKTNQVDFQYHFFLSQHDEQQSIKMIKKEKKRITQKNPANHRDPYQQQTHLTTHPH